MDSTNISNSCYLQYDSADFKAVAAIRASVGCVSFLACLAVVGLFVLFKKYRFFSQRLILYLTVAALFHSLSYTLARVNYYTSRPISEPYCYFGGWFNHYTSVVELLAIWSISFNVFVNAIFKKRTDRLEIVYIVLPWVLPLTYTWILVWQQAYSAGGPVCGVRFINDDCSEYAPGYWLIFGTWYIPLYTSLGLILIMYIAVGLRVWHEAHKWHGKYDPITVQRKALLKDEVRPLIWYPIIYMALNTFSLISRIYDSVHPGNPQLSLWYLRAVISPIRGAFIALVYALDKETRKHLRWITIKAAFLEYFQSSPVRELDTTYHSVLTDSLRDTNYSLMQESR